METGDQATVNGQEVQLLTFKIDDQEYALDIANVVQVVRMVEITHSRQDAGVVEGMINFRGKVIPVINLRRRFGLMERAYGVNDQLVIARQAHQMMALIVDRVSEVLSMPASGLEPPEDIEQGLAESLRAVGRLGDRLLLVVHPAKVLALGGGERKQLDRVLEEAAQLQERFRRVLSEATSLQSA